MNNWEFNYHNNEYLEMYFDNIDEIEGEKSTLTEWLYSDVQHSDTMLKIIDSIIESGATEDEFGGNLFDVNVKNGFADIHCIFKELTKIKPCIVPLKLLREIVVAWLAEYDKFSAMKTMNENENFNEN